MQQTSVIHCHLVCDVALFCIVLLINSCFSVFGLPLHQVLGTMCSFVQWHSQKFQLGASSLFSLLLFASPFSFFLTLLPFPSLSLEVGLPKIQLGD